jgi:hypothetical protein
VLPGLCKKWAAQPAAQRGLGEFHDRASSEQLRGCFDEARATAAAGQACARHEADAEQHDHHAILRIELAVVATAWNMRLPVGRAMGAKVWAMSST